MNTKSAVIYPVNRFIRPTSFGWITSSSHQRTQQSNNYQYVCKLVLATFKNLPAERVQPVPIYCRYIYKRYIFSGPDILPMPIYCRYVSDIALCSFKRIWLQKALQSHLVSVMVGWGLVAGYCFLVWVVAAESKSERWCWKRMQM